MFYVEPMVANALIKGWKIVRTNDGAMLAGFSTKREAELLCEFFNGN